MAKKAKKKVTLAADDPGNLTAEELIEGQSIRKSAFSGLSGQDVKFDGGAVSIGNISREGRISSIKALTPDSPRFKSAVRRADKNRK